MITLSPKPSTAEPQQQQQQSSSFGFWSLNSSSLHSPSFLYKRKVVAKPAALLIEKAKKKKKVSFQSQCQVRTFEVVALDESFESSCEDDEEYWEQLGEDYWYQAKDFMVFKKDRRTLVDRIRTIGVERAKGNYDMEGLEFFLTLQAREVHKERVLDGWVSVLQVQADSEKGDEDSCQEQQQEKAELIASKYAQVSKDCIQDAHKRAVETALEIQAEDDKLVASLPKSPLVQKEKVVKGLVWGSTWSTSSSAAAANNTANNTTISTFSKIRPFPRQWNAAVAAEAWVIYCLYCLQ